ncbi:ABC transporter substrate-binding protein [Agrobacterium vitis]|uniref:ABC transporter substrate-binding protein n=1 Tax=Agrobacterium vitis TaxID=373 RepID=UPI003D2E925C
MNTPIPEVDFVTDLGQGIVNRRRFLTGTAALGAGLIVSGYMSKVQAKTPGTLTVGLSAFPPNLRPFDHAGAAANTVKLQTFRGLLGYGSDGKVREELAEEWSYDGDRTYSFKIRDNAVFQNGEPVTSEDVEFSIQQITAKGSTAYLAEEFRGIEKVEIIDRKNIKLILAKPTPSFVGSLAGQFAMIISKKAFSEKADNFVGAGPFRIVNSEKGVRIDFEKFKGFFKVGLPKVDKMSFVVYADENLRVAALQTGDVDVIEYVPPQEMDNIASNSQLSLQSTVGPFMYLVFNCETGPFTNPKLRAAVAHAIKREDVVSAAFQGKGQVLSGLPITEDSPFYDAKLSQIWSYDPDRAKALLKEAGAEGMTLKLSSTSTYNYYKDTAEIVQQHLLAIGLNVELELLEWGARVAQGNKGQYQFAVAGGGMDASDPDAMSTIIGAQSPTYRRSFGRKPDRIDELLGVGRHEPDPVKRKAVYDELQKVAADIVPIASLCWRTQSYALQTYVTGFQALPGLLNSQSGYALESASVS